MNESDLDQALINLLWFIKNGTISIRRNGIDIISLGSTGEEPIVDLLDIESLRQIMPPISAPFMERMRKMSRKLAASGRNVRVMVEGDFFLNMGSKGTVLKDLEGFVGMFVNRLSRFVKGGK